MIFTQNLSKRYGRFAAVNSLNMQVRMGSVFGIVGENGAGKTTTLSMLATLTSPSSGRAYINGYEVSRAPREVRRCIGYMPDSFGVYDDITVGEYLEFYADCYSVPRAITRSRSNEYLEWVGLSDRRGTYVNALSRGMQQRLEIARCLMHDPPVLILDEPSSGLDPKSRIEMRGVLQKLRDLGKTILVSSHILHELGEIADEIGIMRGGELAAVATVNALLSQSTAYRTLYIHAKADTSRWESIMGRAKRIVDYRETSDGVVVVFAGTLDQQAVLLQTIIDQGIQVYQFREKPTDIESLFLRLTDGTVDSQ